MSINNVMPKKLELEHGIITRLESEERDGFFKFTSQDRENNTIGIVAVLVALAGMGAMAAGTLTSRNRTETAEYVKVILDTGKVFEGWLNDHDLKEGDEVSVIYNIEDNKKRLYAVTKPKERIIATYPHAIRGLKAHIKYLSRIFVIGNSIIILFYFILFYLMGASIDSLLEDAWFVVGMCFSLSLLLILLFQFEYVPYAKLAEKIFTALKLENVKNIDLIKISRKNSTKSDHRDLGWTFYRY